MAKFLYSMQNVLNKAKYLEKDISIFEAFLDNKEKLKMYFECFFPELIDQSKKNFLS